MRILNKKTDTVPTDAVYIGRPSKFGNPFVIGRDGDREEVLAKFRAYAYDQVAKHNWTIEDFQALAGHDLVCWCAPKPCHGELIAEFVEYALAYDFK